MIIKSDEIRKLTSIERSKMKAYPFFTLQKARRRLIFNSLFGGGRQSLLRLGLLGGLGVLFIAGDYLFFMRIMVYLDELPLNVGEILIVQLMNTLCLMLFSMLVFSNLIASISTLFMSRDLDLLMSSPIKTRDIFLSKLILTIGNSSWMALLFGAPVFVAYGRLYYAPYEYYLALPILFIPFFLAPAGIGVFITMSLMRFFPARRTYQFLSFVGLIFIAGLVFFFRFLQPEKYMGKDIPKEAIIDFVEKLKTPEYPWLPSTMMTKAVKASAFADWELFATELFSLFIAAAIVMSVAIGVAIKIYYRGWTSGYSARESVAPKKERLFYHFVRKSLAPAPPDMRAIMLKDSKLFWRETGQWSQLFMLGALVIVYLFNMRNIPHVTPNVKNVISVMNIGLAGAVMAAVSVRFVFGTTSVEGKNFWTIHSAPVSFTRFLWSKFFLYLFPLLILSEILVVASNWFLGVDSYIMAVSASAIALLTLGLTGLGVGVGAIYPKFDYENIAEIAATAGAMIYMMLALTYAGLSVILISRPVYIHVEGLTSAGIYNIDIILSYGGFTLLTILFLFVPMGLGAKALRRRET